MTNQQEMIASLPLEIKRQLYKRCLICFSRNVVRRTSADQPLTTVNEQLISFHGRCRFLMFIPSKPGKYGLKMWIMEDSETFYCADDAQLYAGKVGNQTDIGQATRVVLQLSESISGSGRNVTMDNFFRSYKLAKELMKRRLSLVGTIRNNRKEIPCEMLPDRGRDVYSSKFGFADDGVTLTSSNVEKQ